MTHLLLLGPAREAAHSRGDAFEGSTVDDVLRQASLRYGEAFRAVLEVSQVWLNGEPVDRMAAVAPQDEIAVLPPVSGG